MVVNDHAGRRAAAGVEHGGQAVEIIVGPNAPAAARAEFGAGSHMQRAGGPIPGEAFVPFHVGIVR